VLVRVVGVDLAAEPARTAVAVLSWEDGKAVVEQLRLDADDEAVLTALAAADKAGTPPCAARGCSRNWGARGAPSSATGLAR
jgi:hypothetical protein